MIVTVGIAGPNEFTFKQIETHSKNVRRTIRQTFFYMGRDIKARTIKDIMDPTKKTGRIGIVTISRNSQ